MIDLVRGEEAESLAGAMIEGGGDLVATALGEACEGGGLGGVLADEPIGVLVGASRPGVVGWGEVDFGAEGTLDLLVAVELDAVVRGEGVEGMGFSAEEGNEASIGVVDGGAKTYTATFFSMNSEIKKRTIAIAAFCSGAVGGSAGVFKEWAANISPAYSGFLGALLAALIGALAYSVLIRRYVHPIECEQAKA